MPLMAAKAARTTQAGQAVSPASTPAITVEPTLALKLSLELKDIAANTPANLNASDPNAPYLDRLLINTNSSTATASTTDDENEPDANGMPRAIRIELQQSRTINNGVATNDGIGLGVRATIDTLNFGSVSLDALAGSNQRFITDAGNTGTLQPFTFTLQQFGMPLTGGWFANNALGVVTPTQLGLTRQQLRFSLPSRTVEGITTELYSSQGASQGAPQGLSQTTSLIATIGDVGQMDGFPISGFRRQSGQLFQAGGQWHNNWPDYRADLTSAVSVTGVRRAPNLLGIGSGAILPDNNFSSTANFDSIYIAERVERNGTSLQVNALRSSSSANATNAADHKTETGDGWWLDAAADDGRSHHRAGLFRLGTGLNWGGLAVNTDVQGAYYRYFYQALRWTGDAAVESLRSVSGLSPAGQYLTGNLRYQMSRDLSVGGGASVRTFNGTGSRAFAYIQSLNRLGTSRAQLDLADATSGERQQAFTYDQSWNERGSIRLSTSLSYARQDNVLTTTQLNTQTKSGLKHESVSLALNASGEIFNNFSLNANIQTRHTTVGTVDNALYGTLGLMWQLNRSWSISANATAGNGRYDTGLASLDPLAAPITTISRPSQRTYLLVLRYEDRAGTTTLPLGGRIGSGGGAVVGTVYFDANTNNIRDANEGGVPNVAVLLDGRFSTKTDAQGRFEFPFVGAGDHTITVVSDNLPLPWSLINDGTTRITVSPRVNLEINIPAVKNL